ncbi:hypothetical protein DENSPDRAFT_713489 [Dentipellis sp. KUC8613]|nr:hypothetical protein DENSPDRAFT_713489 [Dentipellis sp. KUC8613]
MSSHILLLSLSIRGDWGWHHRRCAWHARQGTHLSAALKLIFEIGSRYVAVMLLLETDSGSLDARAPRVYERALRGRRAPHAQRPTVSICTACAMQCIVDWARLDRVGCTSTAPCVSVVLVGSLLCFP